MIEHESCCVIQAEDPAEFEAAVERALEIGYRHFDTAYQYKNEEWLGNVLKRWWDSGKIKREELFITTKVFARYGNCTHNSVYQHIYLLLLHLTFKFQLPIIGLSKEKVEHFTKLSLKALQLDYVDLYLIHFPIGLKYVNDEDLYPKDADGILLLDMDTDLVAVWKEMEAQVDAGRVKSIGLSNFSISQIERIIKAARILPSNHQVNYS